MSVLLTLIQNDATQYIREIFPELLKMNIPVKLIFDAMDASQSDEMFDFMRALLLGCSPEELVVGAVIKGQEIRVCPKDLDILQETINVERDVISTDLSKLSITELYKLQSRVTDSYSQKISEAYDYEFTQKKELLTRLSFYISRKENFAQLRKCDNLSNALIYLKGVIGMTWLVQGGRNVWLFGEEHKDQSGSCRGVKDFMDVHRTEHGNLQFTGSNCIYFTISRLLFGMVAEAKVKNNKMDIFLERPLRRKLIDFDDVNLTGSLERIALLFRECFSVDKDWCAWNPEVQMHAIDNRILVSHEHIKCKDVDFIEQHVLPDISIYENYDPLNLLFKAAIDREIFRKNDFEKFVNLVYGPNLDILDVFRNVLENDHYDKYLQNLFKPSMENQNEIYEWLYKDQACSVLITFIQNQLLLKSLSRRRPPKFVKKLPDGRVVSRIRAQLLGLEADNVKHRGMSVAKMLQEWSLKKVSDIQRNYLNTISDIFRNQKLRDVRVFFVDVAGIARSLRTFGGSRTDNTIVAYLGDKHRINWAEFFKDMLNAEAKQDTGTYYYSKDQCVKLEKSTRLELLKSMGVQPAMYEDAVIKDFVAAIKAGDVKMVVKVLESNPSFDINTINIFDDREEFTALDYVIRYDIDNKELLRFLVEHGADLSESETYYKADKMKELGLMDIYWRLKRYEAVNFPLQAKYLVENMLPNDDRRIEVAKQIIDEACNGISSGPTDDNRRIVYLVGLAEKFDISIKEDDKIGDLCKKVKTFLYQ